MCWRTAPIPYGSPLTMKTLLEVRIAQQRQQRIPSRHLDKYVVYHQQTYLFPPRVCRSLLLHHKYNINVVNTFFLFIILLINKLQQIFQCKLAGCVGLLQTLKMVDLFKGQQLMKKRGPNYEKVTAEAALGGKVVGLYFSAHWCPPCRQFTPVLKVGI